MDIWLQYLIAAVALLVLAPLIGWAAHRWGRKAKGGIALASLLLGFGAVLDQPAKHAMENTDRQKKESPDNDEPPLD